MNSIIIRKAAAHEVEQLQKIGRQTFYEAFSAGNTEENMRKYLDEKFSVAQLSAELKDDNAAFYFASSDNQLLGYLKLNSGKSQTELQDEQALEIERIYVLKAFYGRKAGQLLLDKAIEVARQRKAGYIWLGVWEKNERAIGFYRKNGFLEFDKHIFTLGDEQQTDLLMKLPLRY